MRAARIQRLIGTRRGGRFALGQQGKIQQPMGIVVSRAEQLAARQILVDRRDAALDAHPGGVPRHAVGQPWQRGAVGAQQEDRLHQVAAGLFDRQRRQLAVVNAAFGHHPIHRQPQLLFNLLTAQLRLIRVAPPQALLQLMGGGNRLLPSFDRDVHQHTSTSVVRGSAIIFSPQVKIRSIPCGKRCERSRR